MNTNKKIILLFISIIFSVYACKKDNIFFANKDTTNSTDVIVINPVVLPTINSNLINFINNIETSAQDKNVDIALYYFSKALSKVCTNSDNLNELINLTKNNEFVSYYDLLYSSTFGNELITELSSMNTNYSSLLDLMNYQDAQYYPIVEFSNRNSTNIITNPNNFVINAGFGYEYYTNIDSNQSFIPGWTINSDTLINVLIDENKKDSISIPIFIVQNYTNITDQSEKNLGDINLDNYKIGNL